MGPAPACGRAGSAMPLTRCGVRACVSTRTSPRSSVTSMRKRGEIWLADLNPRRGTKPGKTRPATLLTPVMSALLYDVNPLDPSTYAAASICSCRSDLARDTSSSSPRVPRSAHHRVTVESVKSVRAKAAAPVRWSAIRVRWPNCPYNKQSLFHRLLSDCQTIS